MNPTPEGPGAARPQPASADITPGDASPGVQALRGLLRALQHNDVQALVLTTNEVVQVERADRRAPLTQKPLSAAQIEMLLAPTQLFARLAAEAPPSLPTGQDVRHAFTLDGVAYAAVVWRGAGGLRIRLGKELAGAPSAAPSAPSASPDEAGPRAGGPPAAVQGNFGASTVAQSALASPTPTPTFVSAPAPAGQQPPRPVRFGVSVPAPTPASAHAPVAAAQDAAMPAPTPAAVPASLPAPAPAPQATATRIPAAAPASLPAPAAALARPLSGPLTVSGPLPSLIARARAQGASDVHLLDDAPARLRRAGVLAAEGPVVSAAELGAFVDQILPAELAVRWRTLGYVDFAAELVGAGRLRVNLCRQMHGTKLCLRLVAAAPSSLAALGLPESIGSVSRYHQGLAVITGPQGHGKTTTLAAILDRINAERASHVILVEDPIEVVHPKKRALFSQRQVGTHTRSFARALKASLREDPDIIVIGELRDRETIEMALSAAETGHLVLSTMNTRSAAKTIDRLIELFAPQDQPQIRAALAGALKMIISQRLLPATSGTLVPAVEVVTGCPPVWALIRDNKLTQLPTLQQRGESLGMLQLDESLAALVRSGSITREQALAEAEQPAELQRRLSLPATGAAPAKGGT